MLGLEIAAVAFLIVVNGLLAMSEMAIVSSRVSRLKALVEQEVNGSRRALALASDPGRFLSAVQIGITLVGVLSGAFSGATLGYRFAQWLVAQGLSRELAEALGVGAVVVAITYASLIIGELVPKQVALRNPEMVAARVAPAMAIVAKITAPLVWLLDASGKLVLFLLRQQGTREERVTEEEIKTLIAEAETSGVLEPGEKEMIAGVLRLAGWMPLDELVEATGIKLAEDIEAHTAAGFVIHGFGRLPNVGESFETQGWRFEVMDLDGRRVDKLLATRLTGKRRVR